MKLIHVCGAVALCATIGCDDTGATVAPQSVPPVDMAMATPAPTPGADMTAPTPTPTPTPTTVMVTVGPNGTTSFSPATVNVHPGDTVMWTWAGGPHTVTSGTPGNADGKFCSVGGAPSPAACNSTSYAQSSGSFSETSTFMTPGTYNYYCTVHGALMTGTVVSAP